MSKYYRVHTADIAWITQQPRGIFTAIGKLVEAKTLTEEETAEYWKNREYFERVLPVPPFYEQGNPDHATTWFKNTKDNSRADRRNFYFSIPLATSAAKALITTTMPKSTTAVAKA